MLTLEARVPPEPSREPDDAVSLPWELRQRTRQRVRLASGEEAFLTLARGERLHDGDRLLGSDGRLVRVRAAAEALLHVGGVPPGLLARAAYHLGNRHVPVQLGSDWLRAAADPVIARMLRALGIETSTVEDLFEPEGGAYASHPSPHSGDDGRA